MEKKDENCALLAWGRSFVQRDGLLTAPRLLHVPFFIKEIACSEDHCLFLSPAGRVYAQGLNAHGCLGLSAPPNLFLQKPGLITALQDRVVVAATCGPEHSFCITEAGELFAWGAGEYGVLGLGSTEDQFRPVQVRLPNAGKAIQMSTGSRHTIILGETVKGLEVWGCGLNAAGQLGLGHNSSQITMTEIKTIDDVEQVACGVSHTLLLTSRKLVYAMGSNSLGQLGIGHTRNSQFPTRVPGLAAGIVKVSAGSHSAALTENGDLYIWGTGPFGTYLSPMQFSPPSLALRDVNLSTHFGLAEDLDSNLWTWGSNTSGQLGLGDFKPRAKLTKSPLSLSSIQLLRVGGASVLAVMEASEDLSRHEEPEAFLTSFPPTSPSNNYASADTARADEELARLRRTVQSLENELRCSYRGSCRSYEKHNELRTKELELELSDSLQLNDELTKSYARLRVSHDAAERELIELAKELEARDKAGETVRIKYLRLKDIHSKLKMQNMYLMRNIKEEQTAKDRMKADLLTLQAALDQALKAHSDSSALKDTAKGFERENAALRKELSAANAEYKALEKRLFTVLQENDALKNDLLRSVEWKRRPRSKEETKEERKLPRKGSELEPIEESEGGSPPQSSGKRYSDVYQSPADYTPFTESFNPSGFPKESDETELRSPEDLHPVSSHPPVAASTLRSSLSEITSKTKELKRSQTDVEMRKVILERKLMSRDSEGEEE